MGIGTYPRDIALQETMENVFIAQNWMASHTVKKGIQESLSARDHCEVLLCLSLLGGIVTERGLGWYWGHNESRIKFDEGIPQRLEFRVAATGFDSLCGVRVNTASVSHIAIDTHPSADNIGDVRCVRALGGLLRINNLWNRVICLGLRNRSGGCTPEFRCPRSNGASGLWCNKSLSLAEVGAAGTDSLICSLRAGLGAVVPGVGCRRGRGRISGCCRRCHWR
jgi:hypothetical protein